MAHRRIEETFEAVKPKRSRGIPPAGVIDVGVSSSANLSASLSEAGQQIAKLQSAYQRQEALITANTQALQSNTSVQGNHSTAGTIVTAASGFLGGGFGLLSPLLSGIAGLFGGGAPKPMPLPLYVPPAPVQIDGTLRTGTATAQNTATSTLTASATPPPAAPHITVNVSAMDSQSFMDRSADIATAVRDAMLNSHPINDVIANL